MCSKFTSKKIFWPFEINDIRKNKPTMGKIIFVLLIFFLSIACEKDVKKESYPTTNYLIVKLKLDTLNAEMNKAGFYKPTVTELKNGKKSLVFYGASHVRDTLHEQFEGISKTFINQKPEIAFNEGGQIPDSAKYLSAGRAILEEGETGLVKHLCNQAQIKLLDGDMNTKEEFAGLLAAFPKDQVLLYLACERFLNPYRQGFLGKISIEEAYKKAFLSYLEENDFKLNQEEKKLQYLREIYQLYFKKPLNLDTLVEVHDFYLTNTGRFGDIGRHSKEIRDQVLLSKIDKAFEKYDRVFVVFGASHWVAVQPALKYIIEKHK
jgi:hypothetical protein